MADTDYIKPDQMEGFKYVAKFREYLDYLEEHLENVRRAFNQLTVACKDLWWVKNDVTWYILKQQVCVHDISKFSKEEFVEYQRAFFPVGATKPLKKAWEHHKKYNTHHHESLEDELDVVHMVIDWTAMGYKFGDTAQEYYERNKDKITLTDKQKKIMYEIFDRVQKAHIHEHNT